jgi:hypothetical protein
MKALYIIGSILAVGAVAYIVARSTATPAATTPAALPLPPVPATPATATASTSAMPVVSVPTPAPVAAPASTPPLVITPAAPVVTPPSGTAPAATPPLVITPAAPVVIPPAATVPVAADLSLLVSSGGNTFAVNLPAPYNTYPVLDKNNSFAAAVPSSGHYFLSYHPAISPGKLTAEIFSPGYPDSVYIGAVVGPYGSTFVIKPDGSLVYGAF